jgi:hypothetical protein
MMALPGGVYVPQSGAFMFLVIMLALQTPLRLFLQLG